MDKEDNCKTIINNASDRKYLAFHGGGGKGMAYLGAFMAYEKVGVLPIEKSKIEGVSGTSTGAISALMISLGYDSKATNRLMIEEAHFAMAFGEKSSPTKYRAYKSINEGHPEVGFLSGLKQAPKIRKILGLHDKLNQKSLNDRFVLSDVIFDNMGEDHDVKVNIGDVINSIMKSYTSAFGRAIVIGLIRSIDSDEAIILENIADSFYDTLKKEFIKIKKIAEILSFPPLLDIYEKVDELLDDWGANKGVSKQNIVYGSGFAYLTVIVLLILISFIITSKYKIKEGEKYANPNSSINRAIRFFNTLKKQISLVLQIYYGARSNSKIQSTSIGQLLSLLDSLINAKNLDVFQIVFTVSNLITNIQIDDISKEIKKDIIPYLLKPLNTIVKEGGLIVGSRLRFINAIIIFNMVSVNIDTNKQNKKFERRKIDLIEGGMFQDVMTVFESQNSNKLTKEQVLSSITTLKEVISNLESTLSSDNETLISNKKKLDKLENTLSTYDLREKLEIINRYYDFEIHNKLFKTKLVICGANISEGCSVYFNEALTPDFSVVEAVHISMSIPGLWRPVAVNYFPPTSKGRNVENSPQKKKTFYKRYYQGWFVDGGLLNNLPMLAFNQHKKHGPFARPEEMLEESTVYPKDQMIGLGRYSEKTGKNSIKKENKRTLPFNPKEMNLSSYASSIISSLFNYSQRLRGLNKIDGVHQDDVIEVNAGFMSILDFIVDPKELFRIEGPNFNCVLQQFGLDPSKDPEAEIRAILQNEKRRNTKEYKGTMKKTKRQKNKALSKAFRH